jgi:hypothetical protein
MASMTNEATAPVADAPAHVDVFGEVVSVCSIFDAAAEINYLPVAHIKRLLKTTMLMLNTAVAEDEEVVPYEAIPAIGVAYDYATQIHIVPSVFAPGCEELIARWNTMNAALSFIKDAINDANIPGVTYTRQQIMATCTQLNDKIAVFEEYGVHGEVALEA